MFTTFNITIALVLIFIIVANITVWYMMGKITIRLQTKLDILKDLYLEDVGDVTREELDLRLSCMFMYSVDRFPDDKEDTHIDFLPKPLKSHIKYKITGY